MPLATPTILLWFLLPWTWGISSRLLQQSAAAAPYFGGGYLLTAAPPDLERGVAPLGPPAPWTWGCPSWPLPLTSGMASSSQLLVHRRSLALSVAAPDLGRGVAPLGQVC